MFITPYFLGAILFNFNKVLMYVLDVQTLLLSITVEGRSVMRDTFK